MDNQKGTKILNENLKTATSSNLVALPGDTILAGKYTIKNVIGKDGVGIAYLAEDDQTGMKFAIKEFFLEATVVRCDASLEIMAKTDRQLEMLFRFCMNVFLIDAEKIVNMRESLLLRQCFMENGTAYYVMDYVQGVDLTTYIKQNGGRLSWEKACKIMMPVMETLDALHKKGFSHCDVTADNIVILNDGTVKIADFGVVHHKLSTCGIVDGNVLVHGYAPEEEYRMHGSLGPHTDVYDAAACLYMALSE